jgi:hypothetical protein
MKNKTMRFAWVLALTAVALGPPARVAAQAAPPQPAPGAPPAAGRQGQTPDPAAGRGADQAQGQGRGQGRAGGPRGAGPLDPADHTGFNPIFDGTSLKNWDGDPAYWRAENGMIVGQTTEANPLKENTFLIYRGGEPADFELKLEYRMSATNSGIQFRSSHVPPGGEGRGAVTGKWVLKGYQADIDFANQFTGMIYEERGRGIVMMRGQAVYIGPDAKPKMIGDLERTADELKALIKPGEWNTIHLIARGNTLVNIVNGHVTAILVDDDVKGRALKGLLGFQIHVGPPMKIEFRNIYLKNL